ncbi:AbrB/MazE/SpoVT family DNA-binding domain-containing protein [Chitinimonas viridis]|uniref:AbrB/MazE/SpoVT family DNA-binding domain-containing protein n=1 Tax=Chitinimonas viridis TaxID=664880 RepID=A0ABT8B9M1_9NEIS|nr:AbrB/MazE/SpoVT family DNA-binding domain-containing protein [Chitinimonas viridis]MDN3578281.1 AbrB/MazE/SpoVT family DNA-binding domain-containing protein [Chitinimonas viridis]
MKVLFDTKTVQKLGRIVLSDTLLRNAGLQEGDAVDIYFDVASKHIIIQRAESSAAEAPSAEGAYRKRNHK